VYGLQQKVASLTTQLTDTRTQVAEINERLDILVAAAAVRNGDFQKQLTNIENAINKPTGSPKVEQKSVIKTTITTVSAEPEPTATQPPVEAPAATAVAFPAEIDKILTGSELLKDLPRISANFNAYDIPNGKVLVYAITKVPPNATAWDYFIQVGKSIDTSIFKQVAHKNQRDRFLTLVLNINTDKHDAVHKVRKTHDWKNLHATETLRVPIAVMNKGDANDILSVLTPATETKS
jgi:hypothetical protein